MVELALSLFLLMLISFGITEFGRALYITNTLTNAAREGARRAVVSTVAAGGILNTDALEEQIRSCISLPTEDLDALDITIEPTSSVSAGTPVSVTVTLPFRFIIPLIENIVAPLTLRGNATMRYE
jgi:hypothetical protein